MNDPVAIVKSLGGRFASNLDDYAAGRIGAHQIQCVLCRNAPGRSCEACG
jgi:hypothetical protein